MKKLKKILILPLIVLILAGCGKVAVLKNGQDAVATMKEGNIAVEDLYTKLKENYGASTLIELIDTMILNAKYDKVTDDETKYVENQIASIKESATSAGKTYQYILNYYGFETEDDLKVYLSLNYRRSDAVNEYLGKNLTDAEIEKYYKSSIYGDIRVKHILIAPESLDGMTSEEKEKAETDALKEAKDIIKKLQNGEKFDALAKKYSDDTASASKGGDIGWFNTGEMDKDFEIAAFALKKGNYTTTPVKTSVGYHIIYKTDEKNKPALKDVKEDIMTALVKEKLAADASLYYDTLDKIRKESKLSIEDDFLKNAYDTLVNNQKTAATSSSN